MQRVDNAPDDLFENGDPSTGTAGTRVMAEWLNAVQEELANVIEAYGLTLDDEDDEQLVAVLNRFVDWWMLESATVAYDDAANFTVAGDRTAIYTVGRAVKLDQTADAQGYVVSSSYSVGDDETTVTVDCTVDSGLSEVRFGQEPGNNPLTIRVGTVAAFPVSTPPAGWLECDGSALAQATYPELYAFLKDGGGSCIYGEAAGNFNLPDYRGEFLRGWDNSAGNDPDAATRTDRGDGTGGDNVGSQQADEFIAHGKHEVSGSAYTIGSTGSFNFVDLGGNETRPRNINVMWCIKY